MGHEVARQSKEQCKREGGLELMQRGHIACITNGSRDFRSHEDASATATQLTEHFGRNAIVVVSQ